MNYPVIAILKNDKNIYSLNKSDAEICLVDLINIYEGAIFIDSRLKVYSIKNAYKISWAYFFGYHPLLKGRSARIKFVFEKVESISLKEVKEVLTNKLEKGVEKGFWYSVKTIPRLINRIDASKDFTQILKIFREDD